MKKVVIVNFISTDLQVGKPALIEKNGQWMRTSAVQRYFVCGSSSFIETANTVYKLK